MDPRYVSRDGIILAGMKRTRLVANPAAGADFTITVPGGRQWMIQTLRAVFTASAAVANRTVRFQITDGTSIVWEGSGTAATTAGTTIRLSLAILGPQTVTGVAGLVNMLALPLVWLMPGWTLQTSTGAMDVADQWSAIAFYVQEVFVTDEQLTQDDYRTTLGDVEHSETTTLA